MKPSSRKGKNNRGDETPKGENRTTEEEDQFRMSGNFWKIMRSSAFWTAVFTGLLTIFTALLYNVSKQSTVATKEQARAVVAFGGLSIGPSLTDQNKNWVSQQFTVNWFNSGIMAAKAATFQQGAKPFLEDLSRTYDFPLEADKTQGVVPPKGQFGTIITLPRAWLEDNWHGKSRIFIWGTAVYKDGFSDDPLRVSEYCTELYNVTVGYTTPPAGDKSHPKAIIPSAVMASAITQNRPIVIT